MPHRLIPDGTTTKEIAGVRFELLIPTNGQTFKMAQQIMLIKDNAEGGDVDKLLRIAAPLVVSIDGDNKDIERRLVRWDDFQGQLALVMALVALGKITEAEEKNSGSSSAGNA